MQTVGETALLLYKTGGDREKGRVNGNTSLAEENHSKGSKKSNKRKKPPKEKAIGAVDSII